jgi:hypothetical protein
LFANFHMLFQNILFEWSPTTFRTQNQLIVIKFFYFCLFYSDSITWF